MSIHTFGDSHASDIHSGWKDCDNIKAHHIGSILCYSFGKNNLKRCNIKRFNINDGDSVIFCFGEIDCRCHIHKHITNSRSYKLIIDDIISNYISAIKINLTNCDVKLRNVSIYNVVPPVQKNNVGENPAYPFLGTDEERKKYVLYFNKCLKEECKKNDWIFFDIYNKYCDNNGYLNNELSDGNVHIKNGIFLKEFINDEFKNKYCRKYLYLDTNRKISSNKTNRKLLRFIKSKQKS